MRPPPARDAILTAYAKSLIKFKARQLSQKPGFTTFDREDLEQDLMTHLLARAHLFDPNRASVNTFAERVIRTAVAMLLRDRRRQKRAAGFTATSLERTPTRSDEEVESLRDMITDADLRRRIGTADCEQDRSELAAAVTEALETLPPDLRDLCRRLIDAKAASVARDLGVSRRQVHKAVERIRRHFEAAGLGDF